MKLTSFKSLVLFSISLLPVNTYASDLSIPNSFSAGGTTSASEMNANYTAVESAVDDNHSRITALESGSTSSSVIFKGFSTGTATGSEGLFTLQDLCSATYPGSRMCVEHELITADRSEAANLNSTAWILPSSSKILLNSGDYQSCRGWGDFSDVGMRVSSTGQLNTYDCSSSAAVACCL